MWYSIGVSFVGAESVPRRINQGRELPPAETRRLPCDLRKTILRPAGLLEAALTRSAVTHRIGFGTPRQNLNRVSIDGLAGSVAQVPGLKVACRNSRGYPETFGGDGASTAFESRNFLFQAQAIRRKIPQEAPADSPRSENCHKFQKIERR